MSKYYLAVDIGASSGRHILAHLEDGRMQLEEIHRFPNGMVRRQGHLAWDLIQLFEEIKRGMIKCKEMGKIPESVGIDSWGVDYALIDRDGRRLGEAYGYRDQRTGGADELVYKKISEDQLYARTGIQKQIFNTIYQLAADQTMRPQILEQADAMLMIPDYFHFLLSGVKAQEYTNATTGQLVDPKSRNWDWDLIDRLGYPRRIFQPMTKPGTCIGELLPELQEEIGFNCKIVLPASHDTASAVMAVPSQDSNLLYISSGTWSLMGTELEEANCSPESRAANFTNEGGYNDRFRYLKNIMGLWMIQSVRKEIAPDMSFAEICRLAEKEKIKSLVDANDPRFLTPASMAREVQTACEEKGQEVPQGIGQLASVIYNSLAVCYGRTIQELEAVNGVSYERIHVVGGGANADYLNQLTARATGREVLAGPTEATAIGNILAQMIAADQVEDLQAGRKLIRDSFEIRSYQP
ncbi:rhamnulokinase [Shuttleworthella satelles]|uniref:Rhamnulokinase n=1 Tax=Shuttleworthella satelles DSM 14600 TaxID=626523 RepID=C4GAQ1_9FIRM|nr:rhamnulokinase [Shuttleworthia satelles]EEP28194.1 rhamnulokinase [Shuttleworthia satelles DSM 14600]